MMCRMFTTIGKRSKDNDGKGLEDFKGLNDDVFGIIYYGLSYIS